MSVALGPVTPEWVQRYLRLLGAERASPSLDALGDLVRAHFRVAPFENVSSILRRRAHLGHPVPAVDPEEVLAKWEAGTGGGVCFELAGLFGRLLGALGYEVHPVLASSSFPGSHLALQVQLDAGRYLIEVGNAAPLFQPIPLSGEFETRHAGLNYRFRPGDIPGQWLQERGLVRLAHGDSDFEWQRFCHYELRPLHPGELEAMYQRHHTPGQSWVVDSLRMLRCVDDAVYHYRDGRLTRYRPDGKTVESLTEPEAIARVAVELFRLPGPPVLAALQAQEEFRTPLV